MHLICLTLAWFLPVQVGPQGLDRPPEPATNPAAAQTDPFNTGATRRTEAPLWGAESAQPNPPSPPNPSSPPVSASPPDHAAHSAQPTVPAAEEDIKTNLPAGARWGLMATDPTTRADPATPPTMLPTAPVGSTAEEEIRSDLPAGARWGLMTTDPATREHAAEHVGGSHGLATASSPAILPARLEGRRVTVRQLVDEALAAPSEAPLSGRPLTLLEALSTARDREERLATTHAYWQAVEAVAEYRVSRDRVDQLDRVAARAADAPMFRSTRNTAQTALEAARLAAVESQYRLAEAAQLTPGASLPLPANSPHVGTYQTRFDEIFSTRAPAGRLRLIDRTMPIRIEVIEVRASAVQAAEDVLLAASDAYAIGQTDLSVLLSAIDGLARERRAFLQAVCRYNHDIADYALTIAGLKTRGRALVSTLIELDRQPSSSESSRGNTGESSIPSGVEQATFLQGPLIQSKEPRGLEPVDGEPTLAPPRDSLLSLPLVKPTPSEPRPSEEEPSGASAEPERRLVPVEPVLSEPTPRMAHRLPVDSHAPLASVGLYPALVDARPAVQAKHLAVALHWDRADADDPSRPIELADCLDGRLGRDAHAVIDAYWIARQRAAVYQAQVDQKTFLIELVPITLERASGASGAEAMLRLRLARLSADAEVAESRARMLESQFDLTRAAGRSLDSAWLQPSTPPHVGAYRLRLDVQPASLIESWPLRRLAVTIPALAENLKQRAAAVVEADTDRANATAAYQAGRPDVALVLGAIEQQTEQTLGFLDAVTAYNLSIADYVTAVLPSAIPGDQLVATLVVRR